MADRRFDRADCAKDQVSGKHEPSTRAKQASIDPQEADEGDDFDTLGMDDMSAENLKAIILSMHAAMRQKDVDLLESKHQNLDLMNQLEELSEKFLGDQTRDVDQMSKVKQFEEEFLMIQKGKI